MSVLSDNRQHDCAETTRCKRSFVFQRSRDRQENAAEQGVELPSCCSVFRGWLPAFGQGFDLPPLLSAPTSSDPRAAKPGGLHGMSDLLLKIAGHSIISASIRADRNGVVAAYDSAGCVQSVIAPGSVAWSIESRGATNAEVQARRDLVANIICLLKPDLNASTSWSDARLIREGKKALREYRRASSPTQPNSDR